MMNGLFVSEGALFRTLHLSITAEEGHEITATEVRDSFESIDFLCSLGAQNQAPMFMLKVVLKPGIVLENITPTDVFEHVETMDLNGDVAIIQAHLGGPVFRAILQHRGCWLITPSRLTGTRLDITLRGLPEAVAQVRRHIRALSDTYTIHVTEQVDEEVTDLAPIRMPRRRREVLRTAIRKGYYDYPRGCTQGDVAKVLSVKQSTVSEHLQRSEAEIIRKWSGL
ncbi:MAG: hypothetical protein CMB77_03015 [Euryarchaeota archaeon]|nr:hypothetical protein [Euryarchaeota archaeon]